MERLKLEGLPRSALGNGTCTGLPLQKKLAAQARRWRAQMSSKTEGKYKHTSNALGIEQMCCLCFVCGEFQSMGMATGTPAGCLVAGIPGSLYN